MAAAETTSIQERDSSRIVDETVKVTRGYVELTYLRGGSRPTSWTARDNGRQYVASGISGNRAYAITDANVALVRADAVPF